MEKIGSFVFSKSNEGKTNCWLDEWKKTKIVDVFKSLVGPMVEAGFQRDASQLIIKWKNLKSEYINRNNG